MLWYVRSATNKNIVIPELPTRQRRQYPGSCPAEARAASSTLLSDWSRSRIKSVSPCSTDFSGMTSVVVSTSCVGGNAGGNHA